MQVLPIKGGCISSIVSPRYLVFKPRVCSEACGFEQHSNTRITRELEDGGRARVVGMATYR